VAKQQQSNQGSAVQTNQLTSVQGTQKLSQRYQNVDADP